MATLAPMLMTRLVGQLTGALRNLKVYPASHATSQKLFESALQLVREAMGGEAALTFSLAGNILLINEKPVPDSKRDVFANFISELGKRSIGMLVFRQGVDRDQIQVFFEIMSQDVEQVKAQGGVAGLLALKGIANIQVAGITYGAGGGSGTGGGAGSGVGSGASGGGQGGGGGRPSSLESALPEQLVALLQSDPQMVTEMLLKGALAMADTSEGQAKLIVELDRIAAVAKAQGGSDYVNQMASVINTMDQASGQWVAQVKLDNPEWRDVIHELLANYSDQDLAKLIVNKAEVMIIEIKDTLVLIERLRAMVFAVPVSPDRRQAVAPLVYSKLQGFGLSPDDCDFVFGREHDTKPELEQYLKDLEARPSAEMVGEAKFRMLRWLVRRDEGCGPAFEGFLKYLDDPDTKVRGTALARSADIVYDLLAVERFDLVEKLVDGLSQRMRQEIDASHYPWVLGTLEKVADELIRREKFALTSRISANLSELLLLLSDKPVARDFIRLLSKIDDENALRVFVQSLLKEPVFEAVAAELVAKGQKAIPFLLNAIKESEDKTMRFKTMYVLNKIGTGVEEQVVKAMADDRWFVRRNMCVMLSLIGSEGTMASLGELLDDKDARVRLEALGALLKVGGPASEAWLIRAIYDKDPEVKKQAIELLGQVGSEASADGLMELYLRKDLLGRTEPADVKKKIILTLGQIGTKNSSGFLMKVTKDKDPELAGTAVKVLQELLKKFKAQEGPSQ